MATQYDIAAVDRPMVATQNYLGVGGRTHKISKTLCTADTAGNFLTFNCWKCGCNFVYVIECAPNRAATQCRNEFSSLLPLMSSFFLLHKGGPPFVLTSTSLLVALPVTLDFVLPCTLGSTHSPHLLSFNRGPMPAKYRHKWEY